MKNRLSFLMVVFGLLLSNFAMAMTRIHVMPMAFNDSLALLPDTPMNQRWSVLLSHVPHGNYWTSFHADANIPLNASAPEVISEAIRILNDQTGNAYVRYAQMNCDDVCVNEPQLHILRVHPNSIFVFLPLAYIAGNTLYHNNQNVHRDNFGWFSVWRMLDMQPGQAIGAFEQFPVDPGLLEQLQLVLPGKYAVSPGFARRLTAPIHAEFFNVIA